MMLASKSYEAVKADGGGTPTIIIFESVRYQ